MIDKDSYYNLIKEIALSGDATPKMMENLQKLRDELDEREGELKKYKESSDRDKIEGVKKEEEKIENESINDNKEDNGMRRDPLDYDALSKKYDDLKKAYVERYFTNQEQIVEAQLKDLRYDEKPNKNYADIWDNREGK